MQQSNFDSVAKTIHREAERSATLAAVLATRASHWPAPASRWPTARQRLLARCRWLPLHSSRRGPARPTPSRPAEKTHVARGAGQVPERAWLNSSSCISFYLLLAVATMEQINLGLNIKKVVFFGNLIKSIQIKPIQYYRITD